MILDSFLQRRCLTLPFLSQASFSNTQSYLRTLFSDMSNRQLLVSPAVLGITYPLSLSLSVSLELSWMLNLCLFGMMLGNLRSHFSTEDLTRFFDDRRNLLFFKLKTNLTLCLWTDRSMSSLLLLWLWLYLLLEDALVCFQAPSHDLGILFVFWWKKWGLLFRLLLRSSAGTLTGRFEVFRLSPLSSGLTFWGE